MFRFRTLAIAAPLALMPFAPAFAGGGYGFQRQVIVERQQFCPQVYAPPQQVFVQPQAIYAQPQQVIVRPRAIYAAPAFRAFEQRTVIRQRVGRPRGLLGKIFGGR